MSTHDHREFVEGCYRCDLSRDEVSEYTPTTEEVREAFATRNAPVQDDARRAAFDRWLADHNAEVCVEYESLRSAQVLVTQIEGKPASEWLARHDAEVRAGVVAEEPEWEYRLIRKAADHPAGEAVHITTDIHPGDELTHRRRAAGPWVPVKQEGAEQ